MADSETIRSILTFAFGAPKYPVIYNFRESPAILLEVAIRFYRTGVHRFLKRITSFVTRRISRDLASCVSRGAAVIDIARVAIRIPNVQSVRLLSFV